MSAEPAHVSIPLDILHKLGPLAEQMGLELPGLTRFAPTIDVTQPVRMMALDLGRAVAKHNIYVKGDAVVTLNEATGEVQRMTARRFPGWVEEFVAFKAPGARQKRDSLSVEDAALILDTDIFRDCLRRLNAVNTMRLPVQRPGELWAIEFLEPGYDEATGIFTVDLLKYDMTWSLEQARTFLDEHGEEYCFTWPEDKPRAIGENRSWAVQVAAMVGMYCKGMWEAGTPRPMMIYLGNKPGTGKSTLVSMVLLPVFGSASTTTLPRDEDKITSTLETTARTRKPYLFFDDIGGGIFNNALYQFVTSRSHSGRVMGGNSEMFEEANVTQVFATGNEIKFDDNLKRRALAVELFLSTEVRGRKFKRVINSTYLARADVRAKFLSAMCAIVRNYIELRPKVAPEGVAAIRPLESFEHWTGTLSSMVQLAGYTDPLAEAELIVGGSENEDEMKTFLIKVASQAEGDTVYDRKQLVDLAREFGLLENLVGLKGEQDLNSDANKRWGKQLKKVRGQEYTDERGRRFRWGHKRQKAGMTYPLVFI